MTGFLFTITHHKDYAVDPSRKTGDDVCCWHWLIFNVLFIASSAIS